ncbi:hypothetical protein LPW11_20245 [Geomonas sp. RF6]|nr:hypothetical protein LPW11_20245 [Geomonas sp. RF6]
MIGTLLAAELGWDFYDADLFHSPHNIEKMRQGIPLTDEDRAPWLEVLCDLLRTVRKENGSAVLACSALKEPYRQLLFDCAEGDARLVLLTGDFDLIARRLQERRGHFIDPKLLESQVETLEEPREGAVVVDVALSPSDIIKQIRKELKL